MQLLVPFADAAAEQFRNDTKIGDLVAQTDELRQAPLAEVVTLIAAELEPVWDMMKIALRYMDGNVFQYPERFGSLFRAFQVRSCAER